MKDKVARSLSSSYGNSITTNLSTTQILSSLMNDVQTYGVVAGDDDNGSTPSSTDNHYASSSSASSRAKRTFDDSDSDESIDIEASNNNKSTDYDLSDEDSNDDVESPPSQNVSFPISTSTITTAKPSPSLAVRSIISNYIRDQPATTPPPPKKSRVRFERRFGEDITSGNLLQELKEKAEAKKTALKNTKTPPSSKK